MMRGGWSVRTDGRPPALYVSREASTYVVVGRRGVWGETEKMWGLWRRGRRGKKTTVQ
jgi:hypothetical protein